MSRPDDLSQLSMLELFRVEVENQTGVLTSGLLGLERGEETQLETLMRAAHSLKGAARIVNFPPAIPVAHAMEDCFVAAQRGQIRLRQAEIDVLFRGVDLLQQISKRSESDIANWETDHPGKIEEFISALRKFTPPREEKTQTENPQTTTPTPPASPVATAEEAPAALAVTGERLPAEQPVIANRKAETPERVLRLTADSLNRLLGLAGESLVESRGLRPFADSLQR